MHSKTNTTFMLKPVFYKPLFTMALTAVFLICAPSAKAGEVLNWACAPKAGSLVSEGETLAYTLTIGQGGEQDTWVALRVKLGKGMRLIQESVVFSQNDADAKQGAVKDSAPVPENADVEYELVLGNDGFVVLCERLSEGDAVSFFAQVDAPDAEVFAKAQTDKYDAVISHTLKMPEAVQAQSAVSENVLSTAEVQPVRSQALWICVLLCLVLAGLIGAHLYKQWMPWFKKTFIKSK